MRLIAHDPYVGVERARRLQVELADDLDRLYAEADFISLHLPLTRETEGMVDADSFARMQTGVRIVNTSRGGIIDEDALADAIRSGRVAGAALDVFANEPLHESPLFSLSQVVLTPHLGASTREAQDKAGTDVAAAVAAALRGELVMSAVNVDIGTDVADEVRRFLSLAEHLGRVFVTLARGLPDHLTIRAEGRLAEYPVRPLRLAALKGALSGVSSHRVSYVNATTTAERRGIQLTDEASTEASGYVSLVRLTGVVGGREISLAGTIGRKAPMLAEVLGFEVELPLSQHMLIVRNADEPGMIGRVATHLGNENINIANMVVGRSPITGEAQMMGLDVDQPLDHQVVDGIRQLPGVEDAQYVQLPLI